MNGKGSLAVQIYIYIHVYICIQSCILMGLRTIILYRKKTMFEPKEKVEPTGKHQGSFIFLHVAG